MDNMSCECPTEILVDIKENECQCSHISRKETKIFFNIIQSETKLQSHNSEGNATSSKSPKKCETILDISPSRIYEEFHDRENIKTQVNPKQNLKYEDSDGCPTALLIDVSPPTDYCLRDNHVTNCTQFLKITELNDCETLNIGNEGIKGILDRRSNFLNDCQGKEYQNSSNSSEVDSQMTMKRLRWKTPSPQSMSRISKEASKVIDHLNSSSVFDEDMLLTEEMLPVTLNFDELDDDDNDTDEGSSTDIVYKDALLNHESSVSKQSLSKTEKEEETLNCYSSSNGTVENVQNNLKQAFTEINIIEESFQVSSKNGTNSKESNSSGIQSNSLENSGSLSNCDEADDVFHMTHIAFEDKENVQNKLTFAKDNKLGNKTSTKSLLMNKSKFGERGTLRNLSNIKQEASARRLSLSVNKTVTTPFKRMSISGNTKIGVPHLEKQQIKKATLPVESCYSLKSLSQSKSFKFQDTKGLISSVRKSHAAVKSDSGCSSLSSDIKQQSVFATPSRRYSISTPLKCASAMKPPLTPALNSSNNYVFPRYTPQPVKPSRLSFSRSWQPSANNSHHFPAKEFKQQISTTVPSSMSKIASGIRSSSKPGKISFSQSLSSTSARSSGKPISKERFSGKVRSPLSVEQDKKVVRALFTNISEK